MSLTELQPDQEGVVVGVKDADSSFLRHLNDKGITIGKKAKLLANDAYDQSVRLTIDDNELIISGKVAQNILIKLI